jgi:hypothetical protein
MFASLVVLLSIASNPAATSGAAAGAEVPREERKICKRENATESRLAGKKICLTAAQWRQRDRGMAIDEAALEGRKGVRNGQ